MPPIAYLVMIGLVVVAVLWYRIVDASKSVIAVADAPSAVYQLAPTGLRNIIGQHDLDDLLQERNKLNTLLVENISGSSTPWGLEVQRAQITANPAALELRRMQMIAEVGAENDSTTVLMIPSDFVSLAHSFNDYMQRQASSRSVAEGKS